MKEPITTSHTRSYYITVYILIVIMIIGLLVYNPLYGEGNIGYYLHFIFFVFFSVSLLVYPKYRTKFLRWLIVLIAHIFFYILFLIYPETGSTIILIYFIPAISIMLFDKKLFYTSLVMNTFLMIGAIGYIITSGKESLFPNITNDIVGNFINFVGSQVILFFIFYMTAERLSRTQLYYEQVKHSESLKTTGELAAAVAHEIRNPLTVVKGFLQLYRQDAKVDYNMKKSLPLLIEELESAEQVITQLLTLSKPSVDHKTERVNVQTSIHSVTELLQSYGLLNNNKIEVVGEEDCYIEINKMELHQLLVNIVKNAIEASTMEGTIIVTSKKVNEDFVDIQVIDNGIGMSEEELDLLGKPFYSLKSKGTGLGVMICNNIVEKYNGSINYKSAKGVGTTVTSRFPAKKKL